MDNFTSAMARTHIRDLESYLDSVDNNVVFARRTLEELRAIVMRPVLKVSREHLNSRSFFQDY